ncbi:UNVERIFIED_ORG: hypothetical protein M2414_005143 [Rahnella aquatilis]
MAAMIMLTAAAQAASTLPVDWEVAKTSCEVRTDPAVTVPLGEVNVTALFGGTTSFAHAGDTKFSIIIESCNGGISALPGVRPTVKVHGDLVTTPGYANKWLFKSGGDSAGLYIVLRKANKGDGDATGDFEVAQDESLYVPGYGTNTVVPANKQIPIYLTAAVACGNPTKGTPKMCVPATTRAGELNAGFTLTFGYK